MLWKYNREIYIYIYKEQKTDTQGYIYNAVHQLQNNTCDFVPIADCKTRTTEKEREAKGERETKREKGK